MLFPLALCTSPAYSQIHAPVKLGSHEAGLLVWVTDPSGAVIENAGVVLLNMSTGAKIEGKTNSYGVFTARGLQPQIYQITASFSGFRDERTSAMLTLGTLEETALHLRRASDFTILNVGVNHFPVQMVETPADVAIHFVHPNRVLSLIPLDPLPPPSF